MSYTFSVITKNTFVTQASNLACKMYICYKYFIHFIIYMALKHTDHLFVLLSLRCPQAALLLQREKLSLQTTESQK